MAGLILSDGSQSNSEIHLRPYNTENTILIDMIGGQRPIDNAIYNFSYLSRLIDTISGQW